MPYQSNDQTILFSVSSDRFINDDEIGYAEPIDLKSVVVSGMAQNLCLKLSNSKGNSTGFVNVVIDPTGNQVLKPSAGSVPPEVSLCV